MHSHTRSPDIEPVPAGIDQGIGAFQAGDIAPASTPGAGRARPAHLRPFLCFCSGH
jgi:hypothetical protein